MPGDTYREYLPHRRQRPLSETTHEFHVFEAQGVKQNVEAVRNTGKTLAAVLGLVAGLATVGMGATVLPWKQIEQPANPQVAGLQTEVSAEELSKTDDTIDQTTYPPVCWNQVTVEESRFYWRDTCRGIIPNPTNNCGQALIELTSVEVKAYQQWYTSRTRLLNPGCNATPDQIPESIPLQNPFK